MSMAQEMIEYYINKEAQSKLLTKEQVEDRRIQEEKDNITRLIYEAQYESSIAHKNFSTFCENLRKSLLSDCITIIFEKSCGLEGGESADIIRRNLVDDFINKQGYSNIIKRMEEQSIPLAEMANTIKKYYNIIVNENKDLPEFSIDAEDKHNFYDELNMDDIEDMSTIIKMRVTSELNEFIDSNKKEKREIEQIANDAKNKINDDQSEEIKEAYEAKAKRAITDLKNSRNKNILETMIHNIIETTVKKDKVQKVYIENGKLNMDTVTESATLLYTFLEMLNTTKLHNVSDEYIIEILNSLK